MPRAQSKPTSRMAHPGTIFVCRGLETRYTCMRGTGPRLQPPLSPVVSARHPSRFQMVPYVEDYNIVKDKFFVFMLDQLGPSPFIVRRKERADDSDDDERSVHAESYAVTEYYDSDFDAAKDSDVEEELVRAAKRMKLSDDRAAHQLLHTPPTRRNLFASPIVPVAEPGTSSSDPFGSRTSRVHFTTDPSVGSAGGPQQLSANGFSMEIPMELWPRVRKVEVKTYFFK